MIDEDTRKRMERSPKFVRDYITKLERENSEMKKDIAKLKGEKETGCSGEVYRGYDIVGHGYVLLPESDPYHFRLGDHVVNVRLSVVSCVGKDDAYLVISSDGERLDIEPRASNSIHLRVFK